MNASGAAVTGRYVWRIPNRAGCMVQDGHGLVAEQLVEREEELEGGWSGVVGVD